MVGGRRAGRERAGTPARSPLTVLVVDDDPAALLLLRTCFEQHGWRVIEAANGREALTVLSEHEDPDLIVSDVNMPMMDGIELCRSLAREGTAATVIIVSGMELDPAEVAGALPVVADFFRKPIRPADLMKRALDLVAS